MSDRSRTTPSPALVPAGSVDRDALARFLARSFPAAKARFLLRHGAWRHRGEEGRTALVEGGEVIGYCGVIPTRCRVAGSARDAVWWIDLVIDPRFRGRGLQRLFDRQVRRMSRLKLGFPNAVAAAIHSRHGWGVREDMEVLLLPLRPAGLNAVRSAKGARRVLLRGLALLAAPLGAGLRRRLRGHRSEAVERLGEIDPGRLADLFARHHPAGDTTTVRDAAHLEWRFADSPDRSELTFYRAEESLAAVVRTLESGGRRVARVLDLFGAVERSDLSIDLLRTIGRDALAAGASQVTLLSSRPGIGRAARRAGFRLPGPGRFCWYSSDEAIARHIAKSPLHWSLADSDHDEPGDA